MSKHGKFFEDLRTGDSAERSTLITEAMIQRFADISGDDNPVHLDEAFAATTQFGGRIAHGMLSAALITGVLGAELPGYGCIYLSQTLRFRRPVKINDTVTTRAVITALDPEKARVTLETVCLVDGKTVVEGEALMMVPRRGI